MRNQKSGNRERMDAFEKFRPKLRIGFYRAIFIVRGGADIANPLRVQLERLKVPRPVRRLFEQDAENRNVAGLQLQPVWSYQLIRYGENDKCACHWDAPSISCLRRHKSRQIDTKRREQR